MTGETPEILPCPIDRRVEALSLVLRDIAPSQRQEIAATLLLESEASPAKLAGGGLFAALRGKRLCGAVWGQTQPGNTAVVWPPQLVPSEPDETAMSLATAAVSELDHAGIAMSQVLLPRGDTDHVAVIMSAGFRQLADLLYLSWEAGQSAMQPAQSAALEYFSQDPSDPSQHDRLRALIERTYHDSRDCAALNGTRSINEVIAGYRATGAFRAENWLIARHAGRDVGVLILADHPQAHHWELVYMGLVPEARGRGWGWQIAQHAQLLAERAKTERIVLAVDASNEPALRTYQAAGFELWDSRSVYVRFCR